MKRDTAAMRRWIDSHREDYAHVKRRLDATRNVVLHGRADRATAIVKRAYTFAVFSIQTPLDRHERAFTEYYTGAADLEDACSTTVYGGHKVNWISKTFDTTNWGDVVGMIRSYVATDNYAALLDFIDDELTGVSYVKGAFMLAMSGLTEYLCIDSNVANYAGLDVSTGNALTFTSGKDYMSTCDDVISGLDVDMAPFVIQWAIYDSERGEHARHGAFYREIGIYPKT